MTHGSLFSGIGGFDLAAEWMGWENIFHCEWNEFGQKILNYYWPKAKSYGDITTTDFTVHRGQIDILTGGFPCQPYSSAGKRLGKEDDRHLWPEMLRAVREIRPKWVVGENVLGIVNWNGGLVFDEVQADLEAQGYEIQPYVLPAVSVNAPHRRDRVWFVAYSTSYRRKRKGKEFKNETKEEELQKTRKLEGGLKGLCFQRNASNSNSELSQRWSGKNRPKKTKRHSSAPFCTNAWENFPTQPPVCSGDDGISTEMDRATIFDLFKERIFRDPTIQFSEWRNESIKAYGNAIVPQVAYQIFKAIEQYEKLQK